MLGMIVIGRMRSWMGCTNCRQAKKASSKAMLVERQFYKLSWIMDGITLL